MSILPSLGTLSSPSGSGLESSTYSVGLNDSGQVTGYSLTSSGYHAFLYGDGTMQDLNSLIGDADLSVELASGQGINDSGRGWASFGADAGRATLHNPVN